MEGRPAEGGRTVVVEATSAGARDVTPSGFNVRSRVHEYGGGAALAAGGWIFFSNFGDGRIYRQKPGPAPRPVPRARTARFADFVLDARGEGPVCLRERCRHGGGPAQQPVGVVPKP